MYTKNVPFKDLNGKPRNETINLMLFERDVFRLLGELKAIFDWYDDMKGEARDLDPHDVSQFYTNFEDILLAAYGKPTNDGLEFDRSSRYNFEQSVAFNAFMVMCLTDTTEVQRVMEGILPDGMEDIVKKADENLVLSAASAKDEDMRAEIERLRAQLNAGSGEQPVS